MNYKEKSYWPPEPLTHGLVPAIRGLIKLEDRFYYR